MKAMMIKVATIVGLSVGMSGCFDSDANINTAPEAISTRITTSTETPVMGQLSAADSEEGELIFSLDGEPSEGMVAVASDGSFTYTPRAEFVGSDSFTFRVSDGQFSSRGSVSITVEELVVSFRTAVRAAFDQSTQAQPISVNGRSYQQDVTTTAEFDDLIAAGEVSGND